MSLEQFFKEVYEESHSEESNNRIHFTEMRSSALFQEFLSIKEKLQQQELYNQDTIGIYLKLTVGRFITSGKKTFEKNNSSIEDNIANYILELVEKCNENFTVQDLKNYLFQFLKLLNKKDENKYLSYNKLKNINCKKFGLLNVDFTNGITFETIKRNEQEIKVPRKHKLSYETSLDLFLEAILKEANPDLRLEELTEKELAKLKLDFETCLENMKNCSNKD